MLLWYFCNACKHTANNVRMRVQYVQHVCAQHGMPCQFVLSFLTTRKRGACIALSGLQVCRQSAQHSRLPGRPRSAPQPERNLDRSHVVHATHMGYYTPTHWCELATTAAIAASTAVAIISCGPAQQRAEPCPQLCGPGTLSDTPNSVRLSCAEARNTVLLQMQARRDTYTGTPQQASWAASSLQADQLTVHAACRNMHILLLVGAALPRWPPAACTLTAPTTAVQLPNRRSRLDCITSS